jgi:hypothetical protein
MLIRTAKKYTATITIGKCISYSDEEYSLKDLYFILQKYQDERIKDAGIYLSAYVQQGDIVMSGQIEPHYK